MTSGRFDGNVDATGCNDIAEGARKIMDEATDTEVPGAVVRACMLTGAFVLVGDAAIAVLVGDPAAVCGEVDGAVEAVAVALSAVPVATFVSVPVAVPVCVPVGIAFALVG